MNRKNKQKSVTQSTSHKRRVKSDLPPRLATRVAEAGESISSMLCSAGPQGRRGRWLSSLLPFAICLLTLVGCDSTKQIESLNQQIAQLSEEKTALIKQIDNINSENEELTKQNQVLSELPENVKGENLYRLASVKIHRFTGFSDENEDGQKDTLVVYVQPIDENGDKFKAPGDVEVQLWNLNNSEEQALLHSWSVGFEDLKNKWVALLVINYRLTFDITKIVENFDEPLTVKIEFTDYLSGRVFYDQKVIEPE